MLSYIFAFGPGSCGRPIVGEILQPHQLLYRHQHLVKLSNLSLGVKGLLAGAIVDPPKAEFPPRQLVLTCPSRVCSILLQALEASTSSNCRYGLAWCMLYSTPGREKNIHLRVKLCARFPACTALFLRSARGLLFFCPSVLLSFWTPTVGSQTWAANADGHLSDLQSWEFNSTTLSSSQSK